MRRTAIGAVPDHLFICGPEGMIADVETAAGRVGVPQDAIHVERFVSALDGVPRPSARHPPVPHPPAQDEADAMPVEIVLDGNRRRIAVPPGLTIIDAARAAGIDLPHACKGGMCSTCRARVVGGRVEMALNYALTAAELAAGFVLTCQSRPVEPGTILDYDAM
jgi:ring-1,2-phenylacetyl-CoA epoxidase subunit PaaE